MTDLKFNTYVKSRGTINYFLLLLGISSIGITGLHFFKIDIYEFKSTSCATSWMYPQGWLVQSRSHLNFQTP